MIEQLTVRQSVLLVSPQLPSDEHIVAGVMALRIIDAQAAEIERQKRGVDLIQRAFDSYMIRQQTSEARLADATALIETGPGMPGFIGGARTWPQWCKSADAFLANQPAVPCDHAGELAIDRATGEETCSDCDQLAAPILDTSLMTPEGPQRWDAAEQAVLDAITADGRAVYSSIYDTDQAVLDAMAEVDEEDVRHWLTFTVSALPEESALRQLGQAELARRGLK